MTVPAMCVCVWGGEWREMVQGKLTFNAGQTLDRVVRREEALEREQCAVSGENPSGCSRLFCSEAGLGDTGCPIRSSPGKGMREQK